MERHRREPFSFTIPSLAMTAALASAACAPAVEHGDVAAPHEASALTPDEEAAPDNAVDLLTDADHTPLTEEVLQTYPDARGMPADVQHFIVQWHDCNHWLGEPPFDADRARQIEQAVASLCPGVDARGRAVRERHAGNAEVLARIASCEPLGQ